MDESVRKETGVEDASLKIYPVDGYGDPNLLKKFIRDRKTRRYIDLHRPKILDLVISNGTRNQTRYSNLLL